MQQIEVLFQESFTDLYKGKDATPSQLTRLHRLGIAGCSVKEVFDILNSHRYSAKRSNSKHKPANKKLINPLKTHSFHPIATQKNHHCGCQLVRVRNPSL